MTFNAFIRKIMKEHNLLREDARFAAKLVFDSVQQVLLTGEEVSIPKFGTFFPRYTQARDWEQPSTGETIKIPPKVRLGFRATRFFDKQMTLALGDDDGKTEEQQGTSEEEDPAVEAGQTDVGGAQEADQAS